MTNIRFSGVRISSYRFEPDQVSFVDRTRFAHSMREGLAQNLQGRWVAGQVPAVLLPVSSQYADTFQLRYFELKPKPSLFSSLLSLAGIGKKPETRMAALELHGKQNGELDIVTVALDKDDALVEHVLSNNFVGHIPLSLFTRCADGKSFEFLGLKGRSAVYLDEDVIGKVKTVSDIPGKIDLVKKNLEIRLS